LIHQLVHFSVMAYLGQNHHQEEENKRKKIVRKFYENGKHIENNINLNIYFTPIENKFIYINNDLLVMILLL